MDMELPSGRELVEALYAKKDAEIAVLREQNRVLRQFASTAVERWRAQTNVKEGISFRMAMKALESALTATSQPAKEPVRHLCGARGFGQSLDDRCPGCDATSQEGQHG